MESPPRRSFLLLVPRSGQGATPDHGGDAPPAAGPPPPSSLCRLLHPGQRERLAIASSYFSSDSPCGLFREWDDVSLEAQTTLLAAVDRRLPPTLHPTQRTLLVLARSMGQICRGPLRAKRVQGRPHIPAEPIRLLKVAVHGAAVYRLSFDQVRLSQPSDLPLFEAFLSSYLRPGGS